MLPNRNPKPLLTLTQLFIRFVQYINTECYMYTFCETHRAYDVQH